MFEDAKVNEVFAGIIQQIGKDIPVVKMLLDQGKSGAISEQQLMFHLMDVIGKNPEMAKQLTELIQTRMAPLRDVPATVTPEPEEHPLVFDSGVGLPQLNPLYQAGILERLQFDGDVPELRYGPLDAETLPAVPITTDARNPVALGHMLQEAAEKVGAEVQQAQTERRQAIERIADGQPLKLVLQDIGKAEALAKEVEEKGLALAARGDGSADPAVYRRGEIPAPVAVEAPTGGILAAMSERDQQVRAWKFFSTTQGRRSAVATIQALIMAQLQHYQIQVRPEPGWTSSPTEVMYQWGLDLGTWPAFQPDFSIVDMAAKALAQGLRVRLTEDPGPWILQVRTDDLVGSRRVGWVAQLRREIP